jgi:hypothetical protein
MPRGISKTFSLCYRKVLTPFYTVRVIKCVLLLPGRVLDYENNEVYVERLVYVLENKIQK